MDSVSFQTPNLLKRESNAEDCRNQAIESPRIRGDGVIARLK